MLKKIKIVSHEVKIQRIFDPLDFIKKLGDQNYLLLESADIVTKLGEKSMVFFDYGLKIEAREHNVFVQSLNKQTLPLIDLLAGTFENHVRVTKTELKISFKPVFNELDLLKKLKTPSALDVLRAVMDFLEPHEKSLEKNLNLIGAFSYDFLDHFEKLPQSKNDVLDCPDYIFYLPLTSITIDHKDFSTLVAVHALDENSLEQAKIAAQTIAQDIREINHSEKEAQKHTTSEKFSYQPDVADDDFKKMVEECKKFINCGDVYQIVPSRTFSCPLKDMIKAYRCLRELNPSPYMFLMKDDDFSLFGSSPETFIRVSKERKVSIRPIAGTQIRGMSADKKIDHELDSRLEASLCLNEKELAEHMMLVDLARNDIAAVCEKQSRKVERLLGVDRFSHVMHLVSEVSGTLREGFDALLAYQSSMNMGTLMGAPKVKAASILRELEQNKRGFYGGAIGYLNKDGELDTAIIIRSALVKNGQAFIKAGCGVVFDSDPALETQETSNKAIAVLKAIEMSVQS